ncbi:MAG: T9SS type A sorting domain-containing protein [Chitinivibrionales bacterium]|nr:T9SS type A sorting domain-containing protein [Chitinivibrionales bacterium]
MLTFPIESAYHAKENLDIRLYSASGRMVSGKAAASSKGRRTAKLDICYPTAGIYYIRVDSPGWSRTIPIAIMH